MHYVVVSQSQQNNYGSLNSKAEGNNTHITLCSYDLTALYEIYLQNNITYKNSLKYRTNFPSYSKQLSKMKYYMDCNGRQGYWHPDYTVKPLFNEMLGD